jgi:hypothetical protein
MLEGLTDHPGVAVRIGILLCVLVLLIPIATDPSIAALPDAARSGQWVRLQSPNFICYTNADQQTVSRLLRDLERLREVMVNTAEATGEQDTVASFIMVFRDPDSFAPYNLSGRGAGATPVGYFSGGMGVGYLAFAVSVNVEARRVIYHEFIHSFLYTSLPGVPLWLNEGLAEFYSTFESSGLSAEIGLPIEGHVRRLQGQPLFSLETLFAVTAADPHYTHGQLQATFYAESWALTHMLAIPEKSSARFSSYLAAIGQGTGSGQALDEVYGRSARQTLEEQLREYIRQGSLPHEKYRFSRNFEDLPVQAYAVHRKEILLRLGDLQIRHRPVRVTAAREHYRAALGLDATYAPAVFGLGVTYEVEGRHDVADSLFSVAEEMGYGRE